MNGETEKTLKVGKLFRDFEVRKADIDEKKRTVGLSFSSETEQVERWFGIEILDHSPGAVDLTRLKRSGALLIDHDPRNQVGVIEEVTVGADRKGRAVVRFGRSAKAEEIFQDVIDGIRKNVSCGYNPLEMKLERSQENGPDVFRVTRWQPFEVSLTSIPADISVGVGRGMDEEREIKVIVPATAEERTAEAPATAPPAPVIKPIKEERAMATKMCTVCGGTLDDAGKCTGAEHDKLEAAVRAMNNLSAQQLEQNRIKAIENLAKINNIQENQVREWVARGTALEDVAKDMLVIMEERGKRNPQPASRIGMSENEANRYSLIRAINALYTRDWKEAGYELEVNNAVAKKMNRVVEPDKILIPFEVLTRQMPGASGGRYRDLSVGTTTAGGVLVATEPMGFIDLLRNRSVAMQMGVRELSGLTGNVAIPKLTAGATAYWLTNEATQVTETNLTFTQLSLTPKNIAAYVEISRLLLLQSSPGAEGIVNDDLAKQVATKVDLAVFEGSGTEQPTGIANTASIGSVTGTTLGYAGVLNFQEDVASGNVIPLRGGYVTTPAVASLCMQRVKFTSTASPLWEGNLWDGTMAGFPARSTNQLTAATMIYGDFSECILASWGVLELSVNPFADFKAGIVGVRAFYTVDVGVRYAAAFSRATSIT